MSSWLSGLSVEREPPRLGHFGLSRSEEHTSELQSRLHLVCRLLLEKKNTRAPHTSSVDAAGPNATSQCPSSASLSRSRPLLTARAAPAPATTSTRSSLRLPS